MSCSCCNVCHAIEPKLRVSKKYKNCRVCEGCAFVLIDRAPYVEYKQTENRVYYCDRPWFPKKPDTICQQCPNVHYREKKYKKRLKRQLDGDANVPVCKKKKEARLDTITNVHQGRRQSDETSNEDVSESTKLQRNDRDQSSDATTRVQSSSRQAAFLRKIEIKDSPKSSTHLHPTQPAIPATFDARTRPSSSSPVGAKTRPSSSSSSTKLPRDVCSSSPSRSSDHSSPSDPQTIDVHQGAHVEPERTGEDNSNGADIKAFYEKALQEHVRCIQQLQQDLHIKQGVIRSQAEEIKLRSVHLFQTRIRLNRILKGWQTTAPVCEQKWEDFVKAEVRPDVVAATSIPPLSFEHCLDRTALIQKLKILFGAHMQQEEFIKELLSHTDPVSLERRYSVQMS